MSGNQNVIAHDLDYGDRTKDVTLQEDVSFQSMFLSKKVFDGLTICGFRKPSPIQLNAIPLGRCGFDLIVKSKSGTGKTVVFSVIALEMIDTAIHDLQVLILAPTREIAVQIADVISNIGRMIDNLKVESFIGGLPEKNDTDKARNCHIAVGAPGRVKSLIKQSILKVDSLKLVVLDEADKLMDKSFQNDINEIYHCLPIRKQMIATSATFSDDLKKFLINYMQSPTQVSAEIETPLLLGIKQFIREVKPYSNAVQEMKIKNEELQKLLSNISFTQCLIFSNYQTRAETISQTINRNGWNSIFISAAQTQAKRLEAIDNLKNFKSRILLSTDLTARGIDAANVDLVINYDIPIDVMTYLHRMGRAGRYGSRGICVSLVGGNQDIRKIQKFLGCIGGMNLSISKLTEIGEKKVDLWDSDPKQFQQISGIVEKDNENLDPSVSIKTEIFSLKSDKYSNEKKSLKIKSPKLIAGNLVDKKNEDYNSIMGENALEDLSSLDLNETKPAVVNGEMDIDDSKALLESMAEGTFDFENLSNLKFATGSSPENIIIPVPMDDKKRKRISEFKDDPKALLQTLAEGKFDFTKILEMDDLQDLSLEKSKSKCMDDKKRKTCLLKDAEEKKDDYNKSTKQIFLKNKALYEIAKILTNETKIVDENMEKNLKSYFNFLKNDGPVQQFLETKENTSADKLLNVFPQFSSLSVDQQLKTSDIKSSEEITTRDDNLDNIFVHAYRFAVEDKNHWKNFIPQIELKKNLQENKTDYKESVVESEEENDEMEDFDENYDEDCHENYEESSGIEYDENGKRIYAYKNIPNRMIWVPVEKSVLKTTDESNRINLLESDGEDMPDCAASIPFEPKEIAVQQKTNSSAGKYSRTKLGIKSNQNISRTNRMQVSNVQEVTGHSDSQSLRDFNYDKFSACFQQCSDELWQNGWRFSTVEEFDSWFYRWQHQVQSVSDYVRHNIYVKEMSNYQNSMKKWDDDCFEN